MRDEREVNSEDAVVSAGVRDTYTCREFCKSGLESCPHIWKRLFHSLGNTDMNPLN